ncbi:uncharacterized protein I206_102192 [Kwoniella pini CBS 10737]|uniref:Aquaporin n=1 Tax=Kwoniella pini CBS 10737 TaxID=1296096 RepID=A0A1B9HUK0_9TREE|nr:uncharacterized protein I206_06715 [Kwoniella pini CBS 10737]OCF46941.1 hypothetical protein I206_06715 [Kwoniella pini CBS 10737]
MTIATSPAMMSHSRAATALPQESPLSEAPHATHDLRKIAKEIQQPSLKSWYKQLHVALIGEFVGTFLFLFFAYAGVTVGKTALGGTPSTTGEYLVFLLFAATSFGASLAINAWIFFRVSGGLFNPAVTVAFVFTGLMHPLKGLAICVIQLLAGISAAGVVAVLTPGKLSADNTLGPNVSILQGLFMEMILTAELILTIFMLAVEKHRGTFIAPIGIGIALFMGHMVGIYYTGAGLNPARSLGPAVIEKEFPSYYWIYWIGPLLGSLVASVFYKVLRIAEYYTANEGQDDDGLAQKTV